MKKSKLTDRQRKFADNFIKTGNAMQSAKDAGYSNSTAKNATVEILTQKAVKEYIEQKTKSKLKKTEYDIQNVIVQLYETAAGLPSKSIHQEYDKLKDKIVVDKIITKTPTIKEQNQARDMLLKLQGLYIDKKQIEMKANHTVNNPFKELTTDELRKLIDK